MKNFCRASLTIAFSLALAACSARGGGGGGPLDPGDGSTPGDDASQTGPDASPVGDDRAPPVDVAFPPEDRGTTPIDVPQPPEDRGTTPIDVPQPPEDRGTTPVDVPQPPEDREGPPMDIPSGDPCTAACARIVTGAGCPTSMSTCVDLCNMQANFVPPSCRPQYDALLACGRSSSVSCTMGLVRFTSCPSQHAAFDACVGADSGVRDAGPPTDPTRACTGTFSGASRECSWNVGRTFTCTPGRTITVGCNSTAASGTLCSPTLGVCSGDPVLRVCPGSTPCSASTALDSTDDDCGTCPVTTVTCPSSGTVYVMAGPYSDTTSGTCSPAVR